MNFPCCRPFQLIVFLIVLFPVLAVGQSAVQTYNTPPYNHQDSLVQQVLLGQGVTAFDIEFNDDTVGPGVQMGFFKDTSSAGLFGLDSGLVMTSGSIFNVNSQNLSGGASLNVPVMPEGDPDLTMLAGVNTFDRCILTFKFIPTSDTVQFRYIFASEEYNEYACCTVNDAFGFFLSGPGITGPFSNNAVNLALIPGTTTPVSINTVNNGTAACNASNCANIDPNWASYNVYFNENPNGSTLFQYDGYTDVLTAKYPVTACDTYMIKLAIADGGDGILDSGVFLEAKSFSSGQVEARAEPTWDSPPGDSNLYEGCGDVELVFQRFQGIDTGYVAHFTVEGTADTNDYANLPDSIVFAAGSNLATYNFNILADGVTEGTETIIIKIHPDPNAPFCLALDTFVVSLVIQDRDPLEAKFPSITPICTEDSITIAADPLAGIPFYQYQWANGETGQSFKIENPRKDTIFPLLVYDACRVDTLFDTVQVTYIPPEIQINTDPFYCSDDTVTLSANPVGGFFTGDGFLNQNTGLFDPSLILSPGQTDGTVTISYTLFQSEECIFTDTVDLTVYDFDPQIIGLPKLCEGDSELIVLRDHSFINFGSFFSSGDPGENPLGDAIDFQTGVIHVARLKAGTYDLQHLVTDTVCPNIWDSFIVVNAKPDVRITGFDSLYCSHDIDSNFFTGEPANGYWGGNAVTEPLTGSIVPNQVGPGTYALSYTYTDSSTTCKNSEVVNIEISRNPPAPGIINNGPFCQGQKLTTLRADGLRTNEYRWYLDSNASTESLLQIGRTFEFGDFTDPLDQSFTVYATQISDNGCESYTSRAFVEVVPLPNVDFTANPWEGKELPLEVDFRNLTDSALFYRWDLGDGRITDAVNVSDHLYTELGIYNVTLWADNGVCENEITKRIYVDAEVKVAVPNVFTPNGDGQNDRWIPEWDHIDNAEVVIYNRWGQEVHRFTDPTEGWDGGNQKEGVYFFILRGIEHSLEATPLQYTGDITLIRQ